MIPRYLDDMYLYIYIYIYVLTVSLNFATKGQKSWNRSQPEEIFRYHSIDRTFHSCASGASCHWDDLGACSWDRRKVPTTLFRAVLTNTLVGWPHLRMFQFQAGYVLILCKEIFAPCQCVQCKNPCSTGGIPYRRCLDWTPYEPPACFNDS